MQDLWVGLRDINMYPNSLRNVLLHVALVKRMQRHLSVHAYDDLDSHTDQVAANPNFVLFFYQTPGRKQRG